MSDIFSREKRSEIMGRITGRNTKPELIVRKILHSMGFRFRLHCRRLPGTPDIVLRKYNTTIFVHGCFWHGHACKDGHIPHSNKSYWIKKIKRNRERDDLQVEALKESGWNVVTVWECETRDRDILAAKLACSLDKVGKENGSVRS